MPVTRQAPPCAMPPFPVLYLKGTPVFWDDFESGPAGFLSEDHNDGAWAGVLDQGNRWTFSDGNEYSAYITSEASFMGARSLRLGGSARTVNTNSSELGTQDVSTLVPVPSGIVGIELSALFDTYGSTGSPNMLISIEDRDPAVSSSPNFRESWLEIQPRVPAVNIYPSGTKTTILSNTVTDDNGNVIQAQLTGGYSGGKGSAQSWHRIGFAVDQLHGTLLHAWIDKYAIDLTGQGTGLWKVTAASSFSTQEGLYRVEIHSRSGSSTTDSITCLDNIVITDEGKTR